MDLIRLSSSNRLPISLSNPTIIHHHLHLFRHNQFRLMQHQSRKQIPPLSVHEAITTKNLRGFRTIPTPHRNPESSLHLSDLQLRSILPCTLTPLERQHDSPNVGSTSHLLVATDRLLTISRTEGRNNSNEHQTSNFPFFSLTRNSDSISGTHPLVSLCSYMRYKN